MLHLVVGPMFSGKTSHLIKMQRYYKSLNEDVLVVKPFKDTRYSENQVISHEGKSVEALATETLGSLGAFRVYLIDEIQFYPDTLEFVLGALKSGSVVWAYGLDGDYQRQAFVSVNALYPHAYSIKKLSGVCDCGGAAIYSQRLPEFVEPHNPIGQILIGGADKYKSVCFSCFQNVQPQ
jgi:thymidine kinase